jgi:hypothetical protein
MTCLLRREEGRKGEKRGSQYRKEGRYRREREETHLVVLVDTVLVDPVRVKDTETTAATSATLLSGRAEGTLELELVDTLVGGLTERGTCCREESVRVGEERQDGRKGRRTLVDGALAVTAADTDAVDHEALLGLRVGKKERASVRL